MRILFKNRNFFIYSDTSEFECEMELWNYQRKLKENSIVMWKNNNSNSCSSTENTGISFGIDNVHQIDIHTRCFGMH